MYEIFSKVWNMSLTTSVIICFVLLCRLLLKKAPKIYSYVLWSVVLFRLLCPVSISSPISLFGMLHIPTVEGFMIYEKDATIKSETEHIPIGAIHTQETDTVSQDEKTDEMNSSTVMQMIVQKKQEQSKVNQTKFEQNKFVKRASFVWLIGLLGMLGYGAFSYIHLRKSLIGTIKYKDNIYLADHIKSPFVMGIIGSKIYLPSNLGEQEKEYIIFHEKQHIKRGDPLFKLLAFLALCIHWFNPFVWMAFAFATKDMEMSCDEAVIKKLGEEIRTDYAISLLQLATGQRFAIGSPLAFGEGEPADRIKNLARFKKPTIIVAIILGVVCFIVIVLCALNPMGKKNEENFGAADSTFIYEDGKKTIEEFLEIFYTTNYGGRFENNDMMSQESIRSYYSDFEAFMTEDSLEKMQMNRIPYKYDVLYQNDPMKIAYITVSEGIAVGTSNYEIALENSSSRIIVNGYVTINEEGKIEQFSEKDWTEISENEVSEDNIEEKYEILFETIADVTHDGIADKVTLELKYATEDERTHPKKTLNYGWAQVRVYSKESDLIYTSYELSQVHAGNGTVYLTEVEGLDYLLIANCESSQGMGYYRYVLFSLDEAGNEQVVKTKEDTCELYYIDADGNWREKDQSEADEFFCTFVNEVEPLLSEDSILLISCDINENEAIYSEGDMIYLAKDHFDHRSFIPEY